MADVIAMCTVANVIAITMADVVAIFVWLMVDPHWNWWVLSLGKVTDVIVIIICGRW